MDRLGYDAAGKFAALPEVDVVPVKASAERRHSIPKQRYRATKAAAYDAALRRRGSLTVCFKGAAIEAWRLGLRTAQGGWLHYSGSAIATALTLLC